MADFCFKNVHPHGLFVEDCVKRAIVIATGMDYMEVQRGLNRHKKVTGAKAFNDKRNPDSYIENVLGAKRLTIPKGQMTVAESVDLVACVQENVALIIGIKGHWTAALIENGKGTVYDTWNCMNELVTEAWIFRKE